MNQPIALRPAALLCALLAACSTPTSSTDAGDAAPAETSTNTDASDAQSTRDTGPPTPASTDHCTFVPLPATARAGGTVTAGAISAGTAEDWVDLPVGTALGAYTARANFSGSAGMVDLRTVEIAGLFHPSVGVETSPRMKVLALTAGDETVVIVHTDLALAYDGLTNDLAERLGPEYAGKVLFSTSHSHSQFSQYTGNTALSLGLSVFRRTVFNALLDTAERLARQALAARQPARFGVAHDGAFDLANMVTQDRRGENDILPGGDHRKDHDLFVMRVDNMAGDPLAVVSVFGIHGTTLDADNNLASVDAPGAIERAVEESFDRRVLVMHLQGAAGDVSPAGTGGIDCSVLPVTAHVCYNYARAESVARYAVAPIRAAWTQAGAVMQSTMAMEMVTRSVPLGTDWRTFTVRDGGLSYSPFDGRRLADRRIYDDAGAVLSPIDEFNAPQGAALCGTLDSDALYSQAQIPGTHNLGPYRSCDRVDQLTAVLGPLVGVDFEPGVVCAATRTTVSAIRLGDYLLSTLPGEPLNILADELRRRSPVAPDHTIVVGYSQGHIGYLLTPEDWLLGGYEPSINFWGPLEGQYLVERAAEMLALVNTPAREDSAAGGTTRVATPTPNDGLPPPDPAPMQGTVPATIPTAVYVRNRVVLSQGQPAATVPRLGSAYFTFIGNDPLAGTPHVTMQREVAGTFVTMTRHSGREVRDGDVLSIWTPLPLERVGTDPRTHYWVLEWQAAVPLGGMDTGAGYTDDLEDRAGLPQGRYRFHVVGPAGASYTLDSDPFTVGPAALDVTATPGSGTIAGNVGYLAQNGWRLMDQSGAVPSNRRVPVRRGPVTVELTVRGMATPLHFDNVALAASGDFTVTASDPSAVTAVRVTDRFGNVGTRTLP